MISMIKCFRNSFDGHFTVQDFFSFFMTGKLVNLCKCCVNLIFQKTTMKCSFQLGPSTLIFFSLSGTNTGVEGKLME